MDYTCRETIVCNMKDAGCTEEIINDFLKCFDKCDVNGQQNILKSYRKILLDGMHQKQKEIDCLDYLIYQLDKCNCKLKVKGEK